MCVPSVQFLIENLDLSHLLVGRCSEYRAKSRDIIKDYHLKRMFFIFHYSKHKQIHYFCIIHFYSNT